MPDIGKMFSSLFNTGNSVTAGLPGAFAGTAATAGGSPFASLLSGGLLGAGELGNILEGQKQSSYQNQLLALMNNPAALSKMVLSAEQPINASLTQSIGNQVQGDLSQRGLSQAPGIFAQAESQALAPIQQQNYNTALQQVLQSLQAPASTFQTPTNLTPSLALFLRSLSGGKGGFNVGNGNSSVFPSTQFLPPVDQQSPGITYQPSGSTVDPSTYDPNAIQ